MKRTNHKSAFGEEEELAMIGTNQRAAFGVFGSSSPNAAL